MLENILNKETFTRNELVFLMKLEKKEDLEKLFNRSYEIKEKYIGRKTYLRGLIEFSNICVKDCYYCGIRNSNKNVERFSMDRDEILSLAKWAYENNYGSITLQAGERFDDEFVEFVGQAIREIKKIGNGALAITLSLGEQTEEVYKKWFEDGAHRYLLRIETSNKNLFNIIHPDNELHDFENRLNCISLLKKIGFQVGTGVMIGLPFQSEENLVDDILFFKQNNIDMIGMGPYVVHKYTPLGIEVIRKNWNSEKSIKRRYLLALKMIAVTRLYLKDVNIASTTALQAINPLGKEMGLKAGANILMPILTLKEYRNKYLLYENKPCFSDLDIIIDKVESIGDTVGFGEWGDSPHFKKRNFDY